MKKLRRILAEEGLVKTARVEEIGRVVAPRDSSIRVKWDGSNVLIEMWDEDTRGPSGLTRDRFLLKSWKVKPDPRKVVAVLKKALRDSMVRRSLKAKNFEWLNTNQQGLSLAKIEKALQEVGALAAPPAPAAPSKSFKHLLKYLSGKGLPLGREVLLREGGSEWVPHAIGQVLISDKSFRRPVEKALMDYPPQPSDLQSLGMKENGYEVFDIVDW